MNIISLNIFDLPLWFVKDRKARVHAIQNYLNNQEADVICLQESFDPDHRAELNNFFKANGYHATDAVVERRNVLGVSMDTTGGLVTFSRFPIISRAFIPFNFIFFAPQESAGKKGALLTEMDTPHGRLRIVNTHLCYRSLLLEKQIRLRQMRHIFKFLTTHGTLPTIIAGDFNQHDICKDKNFCLLMDEYKFMHPSTMAFHPTYRKENPYVNIWMNRIPHSKRIDYIMHNDLNAFGLKSQDYSVLYPEHPLSDHDPVMLTLLKK